MRTRPINSLASSSALAHGSPRCRLTGSATCMPTVSAGLSDDIGSWKIMAILLPRMSRMPASSSLKRSRPSKITSPFSIRPGGEGIRRMIERAVTLLPEPDSPTSATVSPASMSKDTSSTAVSRPRSVLKRVVRLRTCRSGWAMCGPANTRLRRNWNRVGRAVSPPRKGRGTAPATSVAHLLLEVLVDPDAGVDRAGAHGARAQLAVVVLHPGPPRRIDVRRRHPDVGRLVEDLARHLLEHGLALALVALGVDLVHLLV